MSFISSGRVHFVLQAYLLYLSSLLNNKQITQALFEKQRAATLVLMEKLATKTLSEQEALDGLNASIFTVNQSTLHLDFAPYPKQVMDYPVYAIKEEILAYQHFVKEKMQEKKEPFSMDVGEALFHEASTLWGQVGAYLEPKKAESRFAQLIEKTNQYLTHDNYYPLPPDIGKEIPS